MAQRVEHRVETLLDPTERELAEIASLLTSMWEECVVAGDPPWPPEELADLLHRGPDHTRQRVAVVRGRDGSAPIVGMAWTELRDADDNRHMAWLNDCYVHPDARRQGVGTTLLRDAAGAAASDGRTVLIASSPVGAPAAVAIAARLGARPGVIEHHNRLVTATVDRTLLDDWAAGAPTGYSLVRWDGACPDELLAPLLRLWPVMNDAPMSELLDPYERTPEQLRADEESDSRSGTARWWACVRDDTSGDLVGLTELSVPRHRPWEARQGDTGVDPTHRGSGIGRWLKAVNLLRLVEERPEVRYVDTWNARTNGPMLRINNALGFRPTSSWQEWEVAL